MAASSPRDDGYLVIPITSTFTMHEGDSLKVEDPRAIRVTESEQQNDPVFQAPVAALVDLWVEKYGHAWVDVSEVEKDPFYGRAYARLKSLGALEVHYLTDRSKYVCRKPE